MSNPDATSAIVGRTQIPKWPEKPKLVIKGLTDEPNWSFFRETIWKEGFAWLEREKPEAIQS